ADDLCRIAVLHLQFADGVRGSSLLLHTEFDVQGVAFVDSQQIESSGLRAETKSGLQRPCGIVFCEVSLDARTVTAVENVEPGLQSMSRRCIGDRWRLRPTVDRRQKQKQDRSVWHTSDSTGQACRAQWPAPSTYRNPLPLRYSTNSPGRSV